MTPPRTGRPREFDLDTVLDDAMNAFWDRGYEATSIADLMHATGLQKGSLYKAFGDKRSLYLAALRRYLNQASAQVETVFSAEGTAYSALENWFNWAISGCSRDGGRGCFGVNAMVELGGQDEEVARLVDTQFRALNRQLEEVIARGQADGEFREDVPAPELADFLSVFLTGINAKGRGPLPRARATRLVKSALAALDV